MDGEISKAEVIKAWLTGQPIDLPAPQAPAGFPVSREPAEPAMPTLPARAERLNDVIGTTFGLLYRDAAGNETRRRIKVSHIDYSGDVFYIGAYCFERQAYRAFRADRMMELVNLRTGEIHEAAHDWCRGLIVSGGPQEMMQVCSGDLEILGLVARCDGHLHEQEVVLMVEHVLDVLGYPAKANVKKMAKIADAIYPDERRLEAALRAARRQSAEGKRRLLRSIRRIIDADEILSEAEFDIGLEIERILSN